MDSSTRDKHFVPRFRGDLFSADRQSQLSHHDGHEFVRCVDEIIPRSSWRVGKQITGVASPSPVLGDVVSVGGGMENLCLARYDMVVLPGHVFRQVTKERSHYGHDTS